MIILVVANKYGDFDHNPCWEISTFPVHIFSVHEQIPVLTSIRHRLLLDDASYWTSSNLFPKFYTWLSSLFTTSRRRIQVAKIESKISERHDWTSGLTSLRMAVVGEHSTDRARSCSKISWRSWVLHSGKRPPIRRPFSGIWENAYRRQGVMKSLRPILLSKVTAFPFLQTSHARIKVKNTYVVFVGLTFIEGAVPFSLEFVVSNTHDSNDSRMLANTVHMTFCLQPLLDFVLIWTAFCFRVLFLLFSRFTDFCFQACLVLSISTAFWSQGLRLLFSLHASFILSHGPDDVFYCLAD